MTCDSANGQFTYDGNLSCGSGKTVIAPTNQPLIFPDATVSDIVSYSNIDDCPSECITPTPTPTSEPTSTPTPTPEPTPEPTPAATPPCCPPITAWKLVTNDGINHGAGPITANVMVGLGDTIIPYWYGLLSTDFQLQIYTPCEAIWYTVDSWTSIISLCNGNTDRYPSHTINPDWSAVSLLECYTSPPSFGVFPVSLNGVGKTFTGNVDNEWSNLLNWTDANGLSPAASLPTITDDVIIAGDVLSCSLDTMPAVDDLTTDGGNIGIELSAVTATISGSSRILLDGDCDTGGILHVTNPASFIDSSENAGSVIGDAVFNNSARLRGYVSGNVELHNTSLMLNTALTRASCGGNVTAYDTATVVDSDIVGNLSLTNGSHTENTVSVLGTVSLQNNAYISSGTLKDFSSAATFGGLSYNNLGTVTGDATFNDSSINNGTVSNDATFNDSSTNNSGTVANDATFNDSSINNGTVSNDATFNDSSTNNSGTVANDATFNDTSDNRGVIAGDATFNDSSHNRGTVSHDAAFNDSSYNACVLGSVIGTATYNGLTGPVSPYYYVLGQCTNLDISGNGFWNSHAYYLGALQPNGYNGYHYYLADTETTLNSQGNGYWNSQYYYLGIVFNPTSQVFTGSINGDWNNIGNWKPDASLPLLAERLPLSTEDVELWASVTTNGGNQPTVTNSYIHTAPNLTIAISLTVTGTATFGYGSSNTGTITGNAIFNGDSSNNGTIAGNATFNGSSNQLGTVTGTTTCNTDGTCP